MRRKRIIIISVLAAVVGVAAPLGVAYQLSMARAVQGEEARLRVLANYAIERAQRTLDSAGAALRRFEPLAMTPCSAAHIEALRQATITTRSVDDIGYVKHGMLECSASGMQATPVNVTPASFTLDNGIGVDVDLRPVVSGGERMVGLTLGQHKALIAPVRFADVLVEQDAQIAVALAHGGVLGVLHQPDMAVVAALLAGGQATDRSEERRVGKECPV